MMIIGFSGVAGGYIQQKPEESVFSAERGSRFVVS